MFNDDIDRNFLLRIFKTSRNCNYFAKCEMKEASFVIMMMVEKKKKQI